MECYIKVLHMLGSRGLWVSRFCIRTQGAALVCHDVVEDIESKAFIADFCDSCAEVGSTSTES